MASLISKVRSLVDHGSEPLDAVTAALKGARRDDVNDTLQPLLLEEAQQAYRARVRQLEKRAFPQPSEATPPPDVQAKARQRLMVESFPLDGRMIRWDEATVEDHRARARWLRLFAASTLDTAARHEQAAEQIESAGAQCLADLAVTA